MFPHSPPCGKTPLSKGNCVVLDHLQKLWLLPILSLHFFSQCLPRTKLFLTICVYAHYMCIQDFNAFLVVSNTKSILSVITSKPSKFTVPRIYFHLWIWDKLEYMKKDFRFFTSNSFATGHSYLKPNSDPLVPFHLSP